MEQNKRTRRNNTEQLINSIIDFLKTGPKTRQEIWDHLGGAQAVPKSTLSNVTTELKKRGIINDFKPGEQITLQEELAGYEKLDKTILNEWLILFAIGSSKDNKVGVKEIVNKYMEMCNEERITKSIKKQFFDEEDEEIRFQRSAERDEKMRISAEQTIRYYLEQRLVPAGLVEKSNNSSMIEYSLTNAAPIIVKASYEQLEQYVRFYHLENVESTSDEIAERAKTLLWGREASDDKIQFVSGKLNHLQQVSLRRMDELLKMPYKKKKLSIITKNNSRLTEHIVSVGLLFYSSEINEFYILGEYNNTEVLIRLSSIVEMKVTNNDNEVYVKKETDKPKQKLKTREFFNDYLDEMMGIENGKLFNVRIRFKNENNIRNSVETMIQGRRAAKLEQINNGKELLYTDKVRGLGALSSALRRLGAGSIVEEPAQLRDTMLSTADKIEKCYKEVEDVSE